jgi:hypothetical protein
MFDKIDMYGYGLGLKWDAFQDKTINDEYTNYTVTMADHVGLAFIEAYKNGALGKERLMHLRSAILRVPFADKLGNGVCLAYSDNKNDVVGCVHNVNIGAAFFLYELKKLEISVDNGNSDLINLILERERTSFIPELENYYYWDKSKFLTDQNYLAYQACCMIQFDNLGIREIGNKLVKKIERNREKDISSLIGQLRLLSISEFDSDELLTVLKKLIHGEENNYTPVGIYKFDNARISAQLALWSAMYYDKIK